MDARETLAMYVNTGTMRDVEPAPAMDPAKKKALQQKLATLKEGGDLPAANDAPADFRTALEDKEQKVAQREDRMKGKDVPRWKPNNFIMKRLYQAHDTVAELPTPTGLGLILIIIFIFFLVLIPATAAGETRTLLLWEVLLGKKKVAPIDVPVVDAGTGAVSKPSGPSIPSIPIPNPIPGQPPIPWNPITGIIPLDTTINEPVYTPGLSDYPGVEL